MHFSLSGGGIIMKFIIDILRGVAIGIANIIPGVSGGTLAVSMGIYDKIINAINNLFKKFKQSLMTLLPYGIGLVIGVVGLAFIITGLFENFPLPTVLFFIGLIFGGIPLIWGKIKGKVHGTKDTVICVVLFLLFAAFIVLLPLLTGGEENAQILGPDFATFLKMLVAGAVASAAMVIPGVSGSMLMMAMGYYTGIISAIKNLITALTEFDVSSIVVQLCILVPFGIGVIIGIVLIAKLIAFLLAKFESYTYSAILGLVIASPYAIFAATPMGSPSTVAVIVSVITLAAGFAIAFLLAKKGAALDVEAEK